MKKMFLTCCCLVGSMGLFAQTTACMSQPIPADTSVVVGKLPNGLTYYIKHNSYIPNRAAFHIAQKVGSIQEETNQRGLAHFLEHMAFNGTKHFPDKALINYLETIGVKMGTNLNAYTSVDETVYMITDVPTQRTSTVDSCLLILRDWSDGILLEAEAIDKERGVIEEEWRSRNSSYDRQIEQILPDMYGKDKYADCMPIGNIDVIRNFSHQTLRDYYHTWYRPDLQGIVVVGDIDVKRTEQKIKELFASAKVPDGAPARVYYPVSDYTQPVIAFTKDKEMPYVILTLLQRIPDLSPNVKQTVEGMHQSFIRFATTHMFAERLNQLVKQPNSPFGHADVYQGDFFLSQTEKSFEISAVASPDKINQAIQLLLTERRRMYQHGFTQTELDRAKAAYLASLEQDYKNRNQRKNDVYVQQCISHFLENEPLSPDDWDYKQWKVVVEQATLQQMNDWLTTHHPTNWLLWLAGTEDTQFPTKEAVLQQMAAIDSLTLEPYVEETMADALIAPQDLPTKGSIVKKQSLKNGVTQYTLSNGVKVQVKPATFKEDLVELKAMSRGGLMQLPAADVIDGRFATDLVYEAGMGPFSSTQFDKFMADKNAEIYQTIYAETEQIKGISSVKDLETLFQLVYLSFTQVKTDTLAFQAYSQRMQVFMQQLKNDPFTAFQDSVNLALYQAHPIKKRLTVADVQQLDYAKALHIYQQRFANAADFSFGVVGNVDLDAIEPLLEQYVATLPTQKDREKLAHPILAISGKKIMHFTTDMVQPKTTVYISNYKTGAVSSKQTLVYNLLDAVLDMVYTESVREEQGGTYGVSTTVSVNQLPKPAVYMAIHFETDSAKVATLLPIIYDELGKIATKGPKAEHLQKAKEYAKKTYIDQQINNGYWLNRLVDTQFYGYDSQANYLRDLEKIRAKDIQKAAKTLLNSPNLKEVVQVGVTQSPI
ncbi:MAG: insulinase family protein [Paludibacteraceae bacterium]|nr:insulinase family protein [Paludibacteraceae bacterium]